MQNYWMGLPLNEVPRDLLEKEFIKAQEELMRLRITECDLRVENIRTYAELCKGKARGRRGLFALFT